MNCDCSIGKNHNLAIYKKQKLCDTNSLQLNTENIRCYKIGSDD